MVVDTPGMRDLPITKQEMLSLALEACSPGRPAQIDASRKIMQEGHCTIIEAVVEKKTKTRGPGRPWGKEDIPELQLQPMISKRGCKVWRESPMES